MLTIFDFILLAVLFCFVFSGFIFGLIRGIGSIIALVLAVYFAGLWYEPVAFYLEPVFGNYPNLARVLCFLAIYILIDSLVNYIFYIVNKIFNFLSFIPFLKSINRLAGALLGLLKGLLVVSVIIFVLTKYPLWPFLNQALASSRVVPWLLKISALLSPLLPVAMREIKSILLKVT